MRVCVLCGVSRRVWRKGFGLNCAQISHCFARVYATTPHLSSAKACTITMESDTSAHVLRFTGFGHRRERCRLELWSKPSSPNGA